ncbi:fumarylacetoacetate hydrolase family protein [Picrophilus oshimae]|uniref:2-keto-4-pentenoate hydratase/2-oxohepta-3-ene-1,7-dioic acid hydratase (Catechol pathway) n=1 Tax=Picrophilus torridus (strain ATCC 700027 / DSM 9790 / JCM 10055 / NBRC 100828 / KAW 2/3) TaxID=1122961 RepID=A0A8G2FXT9_PICTO|nr:fumarylacetoacetate hydrolase family protein [Picrophilus oshimae]SMD31464.1 2-keto-4-pentenoate hydratase/2-oxohepta-3-ene-1,7-dioic acid hydratase (catechol pathway) [Picrophilus oshimae DSM 9789]
MKILNFIFNDRISGGIIYNEKVYPFDEISYIIPEFKKFRITDDILASGIDQNYVDKVINEAKDKIKSLSVKDVKIVSPVINPRKIICIGVNYMEHARESEQKVMRDPTIFSKFSNSVIGPEDYILIPEGVNQIDYEGELVMVIGSGRTYRDALFGYTVGNDVSARDLQFRTSQWILGKALKTFAPLGPLIACVNEIGNAEDLNIKTMVNGHIRQNGSTRDMIFNVTEIADYLSRYFDPEPGDIIFTGTPKGVILGMPEDKRTWLTHGDVIEIEISGIGKLKNTIK